jgi:hypothetical protein
LSLASFTDTIQAHPVGDGSDGRALRPHGGLTIPTALLLGG